MRRILTAGAILLLYVAPSFAAEGGGEWPQFLGPNRNGISSETGLLDRLPAGGAKEVWRSKGGVGMAGLAISRGRLVTLVQRDGKQKLLALDAQTGQSQWETDLAPAYRNQMGDGPRGTPTIVGDQVFAFTGEGILAAVRFTDGKLLWSRNVVQELKAKEADYGMASSPLVIGKQVLVIAGGPRACVAAFDAQTGEPRWMAGTDPAGYSSPTLLKLGGKEQIVAFTGASALGMSPTDGKLLWRYPYETDFGCNIALPLAYKGQVFLSSGENHGCVLLSLERQGKTFEPAVAWESQGPKSVLRNEWQTSLLVGDHLYGFDNVGGAGPVSHLTCINAATGERVWQQSRFGKGNAIAADGKLWIIMLDGELVLVNASPKGYEERGRQPLLRKTRQAPALAAGLLYARDDQDIVCVDIRQK